MGVGGGMLRVERLAREAVAVGRRKNCRKGVAMSTTHQMGPERNSDEQSGRNLCRRTSDETLVLPHSVSLCQRVSADASGPDAAANERPRGLASDLSSRNAARGYRLAAYAR